MKIDKEKFIAGYSNMYGKLSAEKTKEIQFILDRLQKENLSIPEIAYMLATIKHETDNTFRPINEKGNRSYFNKYNGRYGNNNYEGYKYRGRGYVQLTFKDNYAKAGKKLGINLVQYPELATVKENAITIMVAGMKEGWFTGKKLSHYFGDSTDYFNARRIINGLDDAELIAGYAKVFESLLTPKIDVELDITRDIYRELSFKRIVLGLRYITNRVPFEHRENIKVKIVENNIRIVGASSFLSLSDIDYLGGLGFELNDFGELNI